MRLNAIINLESGSTPDDPEAALRAALAEYGADANIYQCIGEELQSCLQEAMDCDRLIVWGGDGTIACALSMAGASGPAILPLPGGTMNLFHKNVHGGPLSWQECLSAVNHGRETTIPAGEAAGRRFYVAAMFGRLTELSRPREAIREGDLIGAARELVSGDALDLDTVLEVSAEGHPIEATAAGVFIEEDTLDIGVIDPDGLGELLELGLQAASGDWRDANGVKFGQAVQCTIHSLDGSAIPATLDGEPIEPAKRFEVRFIKNAVRVVSAN